MTVLGRIPGLVTHMLERRRLRWVEISVARAWSHDMPSSLGPRRSLRSDQLQSSGELAALPNS
jgi:hypothetical protein